MAFSVHLMGGIPAVFWKKKRDLNVFSTRTEKGSFTGFSGINWDTKEGNGAQNGPFFKTLLYNPILLFDFRWIHAMMKAIGK
jgi:hypothetical protein